MKSKLVLIDGNAILHRAYHAIPDLTNKKGEHTNAVYGFVSMLLGLIQKLEPTHLIVAFDEKEKTFRAKAYEKYQTQRPEMDPWLSEQIEKTRTFLDKARVVWLSKPGYEADDVIGTIAEKVFQSKRVEEQDNKKKKKKKASTLQLLHPSTLIDEVIIVTGDRDLFQLINNRVKVYVPIRGLKEGKLFGEKEVLQDFDFMPMQIVDYKALIGDSSDNYPGVPGIGPKTAVSLLSKFKSKDGVYENLDKIDSGVRNKLEKGKKDADMSYYLATIKKDVPFKFDIEKASDWDLGSEEVIGLFRELGFRTLTNRVMEYGNKPPFTQGYGGASKSPVPRTVGLRLISPRKNLNKQEVEKVVVEIAKRLKGEQYAVRGTASMVLQGLDMGVDDVDLICDEKTALKINDIFKKEILEEVEYKETDKFKSFFGKFVIDRVLVEVMGEWQVRVERRESGRVEVWSEKQDASDNQVVEIAVNGQEIRVTKLDLELKTSAEMGRWNEFRKIKKGVESRKQGSLF